jgi:hypothetical protein
MSLFALQPARRPPIDPRCEKELLLLNARGCEDADHLPVVLPCGHPRGGGSVSNREARQSLREHRRELRLGSRGALLGRERARVGLP